MPVVIGLSALLVPFAVLLDHCTARNRSPDVHAAELLRRSSSASQRAAAAGVLRHRVRRPRWIAAACLFALAYFEVVCCSLLAPLDLTPAAVRLYNLMHYGQGSVMSAMVACMAAAPLVLGALLYLPASIGSSRHTAS